MSASKEINDHHQVQQKKKKKWPSIEQTYKKKEMTIIKYNKQEERNDHHQVQQREKGDDFHQGQCIRSRRQLGHTIEIRRQPSFKTTY